MELAGSQALSLRNIANTNDLLTILTPTAPADQTENIKLRILPQVVGQMPSEQDPTVPSVTLFQPIIFASLIVVGLIILLACFIKICDSLSWLSDEFHEYRAARGEPLAILLAKI